MKVEYNSNIKYLNVDKEYKIKYVYIKMFNTILNF